MNCREAAVPTADGSPGRTPVVMLADASLLQFIDDHFTWLLIAAVLVTLVLVSAVKDIIRTFARERSRREIAAYIAEGSMSAEQGERLMRAGTQEA